MAFVRKLLKIGAIPADVDAEAKAEGVLYSADCLPATLRFTGQVPGRKSVGLVRKYGGALVLTNQRALALIGAVPGKSGRAVDQPWTAKQAGMVAGTLSESGLTLDIPDLSVVDPQFSGTFSLRFDAEIPGEILQRIPTRSLGFDVPPKFVYSALGIPRG